jgi:hypothetical protein
VPGIYWERNPDDSRLREMYDSCDFTVYPSLEEGFGLPILESLWNARPCICRDSSAMVEVARGGGCLMVDTADAEKLAQAISRLVTDEALRTRLSNEAVTRPFKTWRDYALEVATDMVLEREVPAPQTTSVEPPDPDSFREQFPTLAKRPLLSICITTYNRAEWLALSLVNFARMLPVPRAEVEIVVCDNASVDHTPDVVRPYLGRPDFRYYRNSSNVGMLGNLRVTAHHARGEYVWVLGDDDLLKAESIDRVIRALQANPGIALIYLNYAYTRQADAGSVTDLDEFLRNAAPITASTPDLVAPIRCISTKSENFFTAIYCLVFRRDHALKAYSQDTSGRPFSTMLTCIPTTYHVLHRMMQETGCWIGAPQVVVNMNVSWMKYAPLWILERLPEAFDVAEKMGAACEEVDRCRIAHLPNVWHWFNEILNDDPESNLECFSFARLVARFKHLPQFREKAPSLLATYRCAAERDPARAPFPAPELTVQVG